MSLATDVGESMSSTFVGEMVTSTVTLLEWSPLTHLYTSYVLGGGDGGMGGGFSSVLML